MHLKGGLPPEVDPSAASVQVLKSSEGLRWRSLTALSLFHRAEGEVTADEIRDFGLGFRLLHHMSGSPNRLARLQNGSWSDGTSVPGTLFLSPLVVQPATYHWNTAATTLYLTIPSDLCFRLASELTPVDPVRLELIEQNFLIDPLIAQIGHAILTMIETHDADSRLYADALAIALIHHCLRRFGNLTLPTPSPSQLSKHQLQRTLNYIHGCFDQDLTLTELAAYAGHSVTHFSRLFRQATGQSPYRYLIRCRVERARELLSEGEWTVAQVAQMVGFFDQSHLARAFKRAYGISPSAVRVRHGRNVPT